MLPSELQERISRDQIYRETFETVCNSQNRNHFLDKVKEYVEFVVDQVRNNPRTEFPTEYTSRIPPPSPYPDYIRYLTEPSTSQPPSKLPIDAYSSGNFRNWLKNGKCPPPEPEPYHLERWRSDDRDAGAPGALLQPESSDGSIKNPPLLKRLDHLTHFSNPHESFWSFRPKISPQDREKLKKEMEYADWLIQNNSQSAGEIYLSQLESHLDEYSQPSWEDKLKAESVIIFSALGVFAFSALFLRRVGATSFIKSSPSARGEIISLTARIGSQRPVLTKGFKAAAAFLISFLGLEKAEDKLLS